MDKMNGIFDRLVLPILLFTAAVFVIFGVVPKLGSCGQQTAEQELAAQEDFYALRTVLLSDMDGCRDIFEAAGYTVMESEGSDELIAYRALDSGAEIIDNLHDSSGTAYSVIYRTDPDTGVETNIMIYDKALFLVMIAADGQNTSAVFYDEGFTADASSSDLGQRDVLALVTAESLTSLLEEYKASMLEIVE